MSVAPGTATDETPVDPGTTPPRRLTPARRFILAEIGTTFVVLASEAGVPLADIARVVGHTRTTTTIQYFNPEKKHAAARVRQQMRGTVLDGRRNRGKAIG